MNPGENLVCPAGGMSMWTTLQGKGDIGKWMALADANFSTLDGRNTMTDQITQGQFTNHIRSNEPPKGDWDKVIYPFQAIWA